MFAVDAGARHAARQAKLAQRGTYYYWWMWWGVYAVGFAVLPIVLLVLQRRYNEAVAWILISLLMRFVFIEMLERMIHKPRPYQLYGFEPITSILLSQKSRIWNSVPSSHVAGIVFYSVLTFSLSFWLGLIMAVVTVLMASGRIVLGHHFVWDCIIGGLVGMLFALFALYFGYLLNFGFLIN